MRSSKWLLEGVVPLIVVFLLVGCSSSANPVSSVSSPASVSSSPTKSPSATPSQGPSQPEVPPVFAPLDGSMVSALVGEVVVVVLAPDEVYVSSSSSPKGILVEASGPPPEQAPAGSVVFPSFVASAPGVAVLSLRFEDGSSRDVSVRVSSPE